MKWLLVVAACSSSAPEMPDAAPLIDAAPPAGFPATLSVAATKGMLANDFSATIAGDRVMVDADVGTMALYGTPAAAAMYNSLPFGDYTIFGSVVVAPDQWFIAYPYCMNDMLVDVYAEAVGPGGFALLPASGTCATMAKATSAAVDLPAFEIATPQPFNHPSVHGADIDITNGVGEIAVKGVRQPAVVFDVVDCSTDCGSPGWYELHTLLWDDATHAATFVIAYLMIGMNDRVQLSYALRLPALDDPFQNAVLAATWDASGVAFAHRAPVHLPPPWLRLHQ